ncbi:MAG: 6-bladed beta-propeller [Balneolaceae bacterium]
MKIIIYSLLVTFTSFNFHALKSVSSEEKWILEIDLIIGEKNPNILFSSYIQNLSVDYNGYIYVADPDQNTIFKFSPDGEFIKQFGRSGNGPGEFTGLSSNIIISGDTLFTYDYNQFKLTAFNINNGQLIYTSIIERSAITDSRFSPRKIYANLLSNYINVEYNFTFSPSFNRSDYSKKIDIYDSQMKLIKSDLLKLQPDERYIYDRNGVLFVSQYLPFARKNIITQGIGNYGNHLCHGWTEQISIECLDMQLGEILTIVTMDINSETITDHDMKEALSIFPKDHPRVGRSMVRDAIQHNTWPAFEWFVLDDLGNFWIATTSENRDELKLLILDYNSNLIARSTIPANHRIYTVRSGFVYAVTGKLMDEKNVVRYKLRKN